MRKNSTYISQAYRTYLAKALAGIGGLSKEAVTKQLGHFDACISAGHPPKDVFAELLENYGNEDTSAALKLVAMEVSNASIQDDLTRLNTSHQGIDANPVTRLHAYLERHRANLAACSAEVTDDRGNKREIHGDPSTVKDPAFMPKVPFTHEAKGTCRFGGKNVELALEITV